MDGNLFFGRANQPQGFQNLAMAQWDGNPEPIVREMLQNCLDASVAADRAAGEVCFTIRQVAVDEIPGIEAYREHFEGAVRERAKGTQGAAERRVIKRIRRVLAGPRTRVLFCRDNGIGLNADRMNRILTEGNTDKSAGGLSFRNRSLDRVCGLRPPFHPLRRSQPVQWDPTGCSKRARRAGLPDGGREYGPRRARLLAIG